MSDPVDEGKGDVDEIQPDADGKYPDSVPWDKYVGVKESLGKKLDSERERAKSLEEQLTKAISPEDHQKLQTQLDEANTSLQKVTEELEGVKGKSISEKRDFLIKKGISEEEVKEMSEEALGAAVKVLEGYKPKPDLGDGGGSGELKGSPMELAKTAYSR